MRLFITKLFLITLVVTIFTTMLVGIAWLFNSQPENLHRVWHFLGNCCLLTSVFWILFGAKITFK